MGRKLDVVVHPWCRREVEPVVARHRILTKAVKIRTYLPTKR
ncbi:hypothetical protein [Nostoc sp.]